MQVRRTLIAMCAIAWVFSGITTSVTTSASAATRATTKGTQINLGSICSCSGAQAASEGGVARAVTAWAKSVNASGGINGHPIKLFVMDDANDPTTSLADVQELVTQDHVVAIVNDASNVDSTWAPYVKAQGIPVIGGLSAANASFLSNSDFFPAGSQIIQMVYGSLALAHQVGKNSLAVMYCAESPQCAMATPLYTIIAKQLGMKVAYSAKVSATAPDYTAPCLAAQGAGANSLVIGSNSSTVLRIFQACATQGYKPQSLGTDGTVTGNYLKVPATSGMLVSEVNYPFFSSKLPAAAAMYRAYNKYAPGLVNSTLFGANAAYAWDAGQLFQAATTNVPRSGTVTTAQVLQGLYALKGATLGGLAPPLTFTPGKAAFPSCYFTFSIKSGKFVLGSGGKATCIPTANANALHALVAG